MGQKNGNDCSRRRADGRGGQTFKVVGGTVALFNVDDVVVRLVALVARVVGRAEPDEAVVAAEN